MAETKMIRIQYYRSKNSTPAKHKAVVKGLGLYAPQPDRRARRQRIHPRHGQGHSAPGQDSGELGFRDQVSGSQLEAPSTGNFKLNPES